LSPFRFVAVLTVAVSVRLNWISPLWFVTVSVCRRFDCRRFGSFKMDVAVMFCRRFGLSPFQPVAVLTVAISVCRRFDCRRFGLSPF